ncbi:hypothetical protein FGG08_002860 [Glutinoglossum americanum]|uniref:Uncharacterized protein n=1 Tax=Glutinoglossum americanum TaxID=1670608 RepID=A0A9P8L599_9PEZI|nr:hypothetical protein FGG08_002860 [Glutinoglossum americanum]
MVLKPIAVPSAKPKDESGTGSPRDPVPLYEAMRRTALHNLEFHPRSPIFHAAIGKGSGAIDKEFINHLPTHEQRLFDCSTCKQFMNQWGDLALVDAGTGALTPLFWNASPPEASGVLQVPPYYQDSVEAVARLFVGKKVEGELKVTEDIKALGRAEVGGYKHMHFEFPSEKVEPKPVHGSAPPDTFTLVDMLSRILGDYEHDTVRHAAHLLLDDKLPYADKHKGAIRYLRDLIEGTLARRMADDVAHHNLLYHHAASAFLGCLHSLRSGAVSNLLDWIKEGRSFVSIRLSWEETAGPIKYMRPSAPPSAGNIAAAEKLFEDLGITKEDMEREFLTSEQIPEHGVVWRRPAPRAKESPGLFSQVVPKPGKKAAKGSSMPDVPPTNISFAKFTTTVLPNAAKVEYLVSDPVHPYFFITGRPGTRPLMQWHDETNLASWYIHQYACRASLFNLKPGWTPVPQIVSFPHMWDGRPASHFYSSDNPDQGPFKSHGVRYLICLDGIHDKTGVKGWMLFPTLLKREFHGVRSTIEAFSNTKSIIEAAGMNPIGGLEVDKGRGEMDHRLRVTDGKGAVDTYKIVLFD